MKIKKALDKIIAGDENIETFNYTKGFEKDFDEAIKTIQNWQKKGQLGEVNFDYYEKTGKRATLSIGFGNYWVTLNDVNAGFFFDNYESEKDYLKAEVDFEYVTLMTEDEGHTEHDGFALLIGDDDAATTHNKAKIDYLRTTLKDFFGVPYYDYFIKDRQTGVTYNGVEEVRDYLKDDTERLEKFNESYEYYEKHGWFGGWNSDLYEIDLEVL